MKGFTLIEVLITAAITMTAAVLLFTVFVQSNKIFHLQQDKVTQGLSLADSLKKANDLARISSAVATSYTAGSTTYTSGLTTLVLTLPSIDSSNNNIPNVYDYAIIYRDTTNPRLLRLRVFPSVQSIRVSVNQILATNLSKINFFYYDDNGAVVLPANATRINITVNAREDTALTSAPSSASSDINLRNN